MGVQQLASPSCLFMERCLRMHPAALLLRVVSLYTLVQPWIKAQTLSIFKDFYFVPSTHLYIWSLSETFSMTTDWNKWVNVYVQYTYCRASLLSPSMVGTQRSKLKLNTVWRPQQQQCFQKTMTKKKRLFMLQYLLYCSIKTTLLYIEERHFVEVFIAYNILLLLRSVL